MYKKLIESDYRAENYEIARHDDTLNVTLTYPPYTDADNERGGCRYIAINQESVRASDGIRIYYDFDRDGYVVQQPKPHLRKISEDGYDDTSPDWVEMGFFQAWVLDDRPDSGVPTAEEYEAADREYETKIAAEQKDGK